MTEKLLLQQLCIVFRKNIGYLYAIANDAKAILDFDDSSILKFFIKDASPDPMLDIDKVVGMVLENNGTKIYK